MEHTEKLTSSPVVGARKANKSALVSERDRHRALWGSAIGSTIEWYDYFLFGVMSATVFGPLFFPSDNPVTSQLFALGSFAAAFLFRPIGGIVFSHLGDRIGRKQTLFVTLTLMGLSTVVMGLLPTYAQIGIWAPILLTILRLAQGLALGGEWGGGLLLAVEYSPRERRGFYGAVPQVGGMVGLTLGNAITAGLSNFLSEQDFLSWGWRIPFVASFILLFIGLWIRSHVDETPSFKAVMAKGHSKRVPLLETLTKHKRSVLIAIGAKLIETSGFIFFATYTISYLTGIGYDRSTSINLVLAASVIAIPTMLFFGSLSDKVGRKRQYMLGVIAMVLFIVPYFWLLNLGSTVAVLIALIIGFSIIAMSYGSVLGTFFAEIFPADVRYTGISLGYQIGAALVGGPMPLIAASLLAYTSGNYYSIAAFIVMCALISLVAVGMAEDKTGKDLD